MYERCWWFFFIFSECKAVHRLSRHRMFTITAYNENRYFLQVFLKIMFRKPTRLCCKPIHKTGDEHSIILICITSRVVASFWYQEGAHQIRTREHFNSGEGNNRFFLLGGNHKLPGEEKAPWSPWLLVWSHRLPARIVVDMLLALCKPVVWPLFQKVREQLRVKLKTLCPKVKKKTGEYKKVLNFFIGKGRQGNAFIPRRYGL